MLKHMEDFSDPILELFAKRKDADFLESRMEELQNEAKQKKVHRQLSGAKKGHLRGD
ncbi:hypothetical protein MD588_09715 [Photobacterium sp. SDRW27]|uniref:hypothetical protein n=1 Tax=Photobacterium obscurum TaxID=2829490 RepID=UPI002244A592|nr:hypothetical protein [Photobacterium obscurum]MCW8329082.1 hypothetical protein [Photobacterium obscurum]